MAHYIWKNRLVFICNPKLGDHRSLQECLCERAYDDLLDRCCFLSNQITYVNIGANIGAFDFLLIDRNLHIKTSLAVELNPFTYLRCLLNFQANQLTSTRLVNAGLAGMNGSLKFQPSTNSRSDSIFETANTKSDGVEVELLTLETLLNNYSNKLTVFDLLKLDCEGAEYGVIRLSSVDVLRRFQHIIVEFHPEPENESVNAAYAKLKQAGFSSMRTRPGKFLFTDLFIRTGNPK
jgi:FkbM family methyltransferase